MKSDPFPHLPPHTQKSSSGELSKYERKIKTVVFRKQEWKISSQTQCKEKFIVRTFNLRVNKGND